ncbi:hypothetical protein [Nocardiopsis sp. FIRDI 009]|uniref:hypothetical protein n=1 Tax=Nocardiopsis sp. FIRDI 009 TaxID=714197 RepID=UPI001E325AAD|nr:hypothetical protein [Nocardiopsis sp. FIRDI 009]
MPPRRVVRRGGTGTLGFEEIRGGERVRTGIRLVGTLLMAGAVAGCASALGGGRACTEIGVPVGVALEVAPPDAAGVRSAEVEVCWDGRCRSSEVELSESTESVDEGCEDGTCGARSVPTGGRHGFAFVEGLPAEPVEVRLALLGEDGEELLTDTVTVTPEMLEPNGPGCGEGGPQAGVVVEDGALRER